MTFTSGQLRDDFQRSSPDAHAIARHWVDQAKGFKGNAPAAADLATAITGVGYDLTMQGAPQLEIDIEDQDWNLLDSGFFDPTESGKLVDNIRINYPEGSRYNWRLFQFSPRADYSVQTYWIPRVVADLMSLKGPFSASRASRTRAEFLKMCVDKVPYAHFYSKQLDVKQKIAPIKVPKSASAIRTSGAKSVGLTAKGATAHNLTVKGSAMSAVQRDTAAKLLQVADQLNAGTVATVALIFDAIFESDMGQDMSSNGSYGGVLGGSVGIFAPDASSIVGEATAALKGGQGYKSMIQLATQSQDPIWVGCQSTIATPFDSRGYSTQYEAQNVPGGLQGALKEAEAIVRAGGGAAGALAGTIEVVQQYNFTIGTTQDKHENFWTGMNRLAQEVNWELVVDGDDIYYDSDITLCRAQLADVIDRKDEAVVDWTYDWDAGAVATNFQLVLQDDPFQFRPADVLLLTSFGPASKDSTIKLPGRWLVGEIQRNPADIKSTYTLVQPTKPLPEPAPQLKSQSASGNGLLPVIRGGATNPAPGATWGRLDMGFDGDYGPAGAVAPYNGTVHVPGIGGWPGQGVYFYIVNDDQGGPDYTRAMYFAEGATPAVADGTHVTVGQKIGNPVAHGGTGAPGNFEIGPANTTNGDCLAKSYGLGSSGARNMVMSFYRWMRQLGAGASTNTSNAGAP